MQGRNAHHWDGCYPSLGLSLSNTMVIILSEMVQGGGKSTPLLLSFCKQVAAGVGVGKEGKRGGGARGRRVRGSSVRGVVRGTGERGEDV